MMVIELTVHNALIEQHAMVAVVGSSARTSIISGGGVGLSEYVEVVQLCCDAIIERNIRHLHTTSTHSDTPCIV